MRANSELFAGLPAHVSHAQAARLAELLEAAEEEGLALGQGQLGRVAEVLAETADSGAVTDLLDSVEEALAAPRPFAASGAELPEGTTLSQPLQHPKEVADFLHAYDRVIATPESERALDTLFGHTKSGSKGISTRLGRFQPVRTRAAASELESIIELQSREGVEHIELVPSSTEGRSVDKVLHVRKDGSIVRMRYEDTTVTGAPFGYKLLGRGGQGVARVDQLERAISSKVTSTPGRLSQFDAPMAGVPEGGVLAVHVPRPGPTGVQDVDDAMAAMAPELAASSVQGVEFYLPGQGGLRRTVLRYARQTDGTFTLISKAPAAP